MRELGLPADFQLPLSGSLRFAKLMLLRLMTLSTPSLGITQEIELVVRADEPLAFNSLSRDHRRVSGDCGWPPVVALSTPSLGITHASSGALQSWWRRLSTPSLGITSVPENHGVEGHGAFNSLSRDHRARFRDFSALRGFLPRHPFAQMISKTTIWIYRFAPL